MWSTYGAVFEFVCSFVLVPWLVDLQPFKNVKTTFNLGSHAKTGLKWWRFHLSGYSLLIPDIVSIAQFNNTGLLKCQNLLLCHWMYLSFWLDIDILKIQIKLWKVWDHWLHPCTCHSPWHHSSGSKWQGFTQHLQVNWSGDLVFLKLTLWENKKMKV